jgi:hypothetical protein
MRFSVLFLVLFAVVMAMDMPNDGTYVVLIKDALGDLNALGNVLGGDFEGDVKTRAILQVLNDIPEYPAFQLLLTHLQLQEDMVNLPAPLFIQHIVERGLHRYFTSLCDHDQVFSRWILPDISGEKSIFNQSLLFLTHSYKIIKIIADHGGNCNLRNEIGQSVLMQHMLHNDVARGNLTKKTVALILYRADPDEALYYLAHREDHGLMEDLREVIEFKEDVEEGMETFRETLENPEPNYLNTLSEEIKAVAYLELLNGINRSKEELIAGFPI